MRFQFYFLDAGEQGAPILTEASPEWERAINNTIGTFSADAVAEGNIRFQEVADNRQSWQGQIVLMASLGHPPGSILAVEVINSFPNQPRRLEWAWSDGSAQV